MAVKVWYNGYRMRRFGRCREIGAVPDNWKVTCIIPINKRRDDRREYADYGEFRKLYIKFFIIKLVERKKREYERARKFKEC